MEGFSMPKRILLKEAFRSHLKHCLLMTMQYRFNRALEMVIRHLGLSLTTSNAFLCFSYSTSVKQTVRRGL
jgi:hypothetical protein